MDRNYSYFLDKEGRIWHEGTEVTDPRFAMLVHKTMQHTNNGLLVRCAGENCFLRVEDVPYVVQDVALYKDSDGLLKRVDLIFPGGYTEQLDPTTLCVSDSNVLYCRVRNGEFSARFTRKSFFRLAPFIEQVAKEGPYYIKVANQRFPLPELP